MTRSRNGAGGFRRQPRIADQMTLEYYACVERSDHAAHAGDLVAALEWHQAVPMFRRSRHRAVLQKLVELGGDLPEWVWSRLLVYLALRCEEGDTGAVARAGRELVVEAFHGDLLDRCYEQSGDPIRVFARVAAESWVHHQHVAFELRVLEGFIDEFATGLLAEHADLARRWIGAPLRGYQLGVQRPGARLEVRVAGRDDSTEVLDIGARSCAPGGWVLGRLVPSGIGELLMFDSPPLPVDERLARKVATAANPWAFVQRAVERGRLAQSKILRKDYELTTDVLEPELVRFGTPPRDLARVMEQLRSGRDEVKRAAYRILRRAAQGEVASTDQSYVGAAVQNLAAFDDVRRTLTRAEHADLWSRWSEEVAPPSRRRLLELAHAAGTLRAAEGPDAVA